MRIGVDIDGVVADSFPAWLDELNTYFNRSVPAITDYQIHSLFNVSWDEMDYFFASQKEKLFMMPQPVLGAKEGIENVLAAGHEIVYVTARWPDEEPVTREWMKKFAIPHQEMLFTGGDKGKAEVATEMELNLFIEDYLINAQQIAGTGIPVLLLDSIYNQGDGGERIIRCRNWEEIYETIESLSNEKNKEN